MEKRNSEEIDLYDLLVKTILFFRRNIWLFLTFPLIGLIVAATKLETSHSTYVGKMVVYSDIVRLSSAAKILAPLNNLISDGERDSLAAYLHLTEEQAKSILTISTEGITNQLLTYRDSVFIIHAELTDKKNFPALQKGLLLFLQENHFVRVRTQARKDAELAVANRIGSELRSIDSLKSRFRHGSVALADPGALSSQSIELFKAQLLHRNAAAFLSGAELISGFSSYRKVTVTSNAVLLVFGVVGGFIAAFFLIMLRAVYRIAKS